MSTRSQIEFTVKFEGKNGKTYEEKRTIYQHSDGYPEGMIPELVEFLRWNSGRNSDMEYQAANFIYWAKKTYMEQYVKEMDKVTQDHNSAVKIGFGVCNNGELHSDIEYFYKVINDQTKAKDVFHEHENITIECFKVSGGFSKKQKLVKIHTYKITKAMLEGTEKIQVARELEA